MGQNKEELKHDIKKAIKDIEDQLPEQKVKTMMLVFEKHLNLNQGTMLLDKNDYELIKSIAHREYIDKAFPKYLGKNLREVSAIEARVLCIIEATISYLISKDVFNRKPKFDYRSKK